jgi:plastocyanin
MKKLFVVLAILFIGILLAGCTSQQAAPATATPTPVPTTVATAVPTIEPTKEVVVVVVNKTANETATPTPTPTPNPTYTITFTQDLTIVPDATAYVKVGTKVIWANNDAFKPHAIQANDIVTGQYFGSSNPISIPYGGSYAVVFDKAGSYDYTTGPYQPAMEGKIVVQA